MAKTKRTVEEAEVAAAANSDSKLITQSKLSHFATGFWDKIKRRYDNVLNGASLSESASPDKKLTFTRVSGLILLKLIYKTTQGYKIKMNLNKMYQQIMLPY